MYCMIDGNERDKATFQPERDAIAWSGACGSWLKIAQDSLGGGLASQPVLTILSMLSPRTFRSAD